MDSPVTAPTEAQESLIGHIAYRTARQYSGVEASDVRQELRAMWYERWGDIAPYVSDVDVERGTGRLGRTLGRWASEYGRRQAEWYRGYLGDDYTYTRAQVRAILPHIFDAGSWSTLARRGDGIGGGRQDPATGGEALATYGDARRAWDLLQRDDKHVLMLAYILPLGERPDWPQVAEDLELTESGARKRAARALGRMAAIMNGAASREYSRRAMSNSAAQAMTRGYW